MAIYTVRGTADYKAQWTETPVGPAWSALDDTAKEPSTPDLTDYITSVATPGSACQLNLADLTLAHGERIASVVAWAYGHASTSNTISLYFTDASGVSLNTGTVYSSTSDGWFQNAIDGRLLDQTKLNALGIGVNCNGSSTGSRIYAMYAEILTVVDDYGKVIFDDRPSMWWRFAGSGAERVRDYSGNGRSGSLVGLASRSLTQLVPNGISSSLVLARPVVSTDASGIVADSYKPYAQNSQRSLECWFMATDNSGLALTTFAGDGTATFGPHPTLEYFAGDSESSYSHFYTRVSSYPVGWFDLPVSRDQHPGLGNSGKMSPGTKAKFVEVGEIHHAVWCYDDKRLEYWFYLDGVLVGKATSPGAYGYPFGYDATSHDPGHLTWGYRGVIGGSGSNAATATETFVGSVAEVAVYERVLTAREVQRHYQAGRHSVLAAA